MLDGRVQKCSVAAFGAALAIPLQLCVRRRHLCRDRDRQGLLHLPAVGQADGMKGAIAVIVAVGLAVPAVVGAGSNLAGRTGQSAASTRISFYANLAAALTTRSPSRLLLCALQ
jgi:hypothetical protein